MPKRTTPKADSSAFVCSKPQTRTTPAETTELVATRRMEQLWRRVPEYARPFVTLMSLLIGMLLLFLLAGHISIEEWLILLILGPLFVIGIPIAFVVLVVGYQQQRKLPAETASPKSHEWPKP